MDAVTIFEIGMAVIGLIGVVDYIRCMRRRYGENPKDATWRK